MTARKPGVYWSVPGPASRSIIYWAVSRVGGEFDVSEVDPRGIELTLSVLALNPRSE